MQGMEGSIGAQGPAGVPGIRVSHYMYNYTNLM